MDVLTYRPGEVTLSICGYVVEGWTSIAIARNTPTFKQIRGIRGKNTRVMNADTSGTIRVNLTQTSVANDVFSELLAMDKRFATNRLEVTIKDNSGTSLFSSIKAYIESYPETTFSASQTERNWTILCDSMDGYFIGGNAEQGFDLGSILSNLTS